MKRNFELTAFMFGLLFVLISLSPSSARAQYDDEQYNDNVSLETFYDELSPYGVWIDDPQYGRVWRPDVDQDEFRPYYTNGHWEMTKYGNTWVSDYNWGWAPFHYGRWQHHSNRGWLWIPGTEWGPAWVSWRSGGGNYGWAPLGPGINININIGRIPDFWWVFVPQRSIYYHSYPRYDRRRNINIYHNTVIINNTYVYNRNRYYTGPRADEIRRVTSRPVVIHDVRNQRPSRYANNGNNRPEVNRGQYSSNPRPIRPSDNSGRSSNGGRPGSTIIDRPDNSREREAVNGRTERPVRTSERPAEQNATRSEQKLPASGQRSSRTYDNQDIRGNQPAQRERQPVTERQVSRPEPQRAERPAQREVSRDNGGQQNQSSGRSSSSGRSPERSSSGGRPSRAQ